METRHLEKSSTTVQWGLDYLVREIVVCLKNLFQSRQPSARFGGHREDGQVPAWDMVTVVIMAIIMVVVMSSCKKVREDTFFDNENMVQEVKKGASTDDTTYLIESLTNSAETSIVADSSLNNVLKIIVSQIRV